MDLQLVENSVFAMEAVLKMWLQEQGGDREHLHLLLPSCLDSPIPGTGYAHKHISSGLLASWLYVILADSGKTSVSMDPCTVYIVHI